MTEADIHAWVTRAESILAGAAFVVLLLVPAPLGRHRRAGWGRTIPMRRGGC